jgi:hypothetical protein
MLSRDFWDRRREFGSLWSRERERLPTLDDDVFAIRRQSGESLLAAGEQNMSHAGGDDQPAPPAAGFGRTNSHSRLAS